MSLAEVDVRRRSALEAHLDQYLGGGAWVHLEIVSDVVRVDLHFHEPTYLRPFWVVVTAGMSDLPMPGAPEGGRYAEVFLALEPGWPMGPERWDDYANWWPMALLKTVARCPHVTRAPLGLFHTLAASEPPRPFAPGTELSAVMLIPPLTLPEEFKQVPVAGREPTTLHAVLPLHPEELRAVRAQGPEVLFDAIDRDDVTELLDPRRPSMLAAGR